MTMGPRSAGTAVSVLTALLLTVGNARAGTTDIFDNLANPPFHGESLYPEGTASNPEAASFFTDNYGGAETGEISSLTLDLACGAGGDGAANECGVATTANPYIVRTSGGASTGSTITLSGTNPTATLQVGDLVKLDGANNPTAYVTAITGPNTVTVNTAVTVGSTETVSFLHQGEITVSLYADSNTSIIPNTNSVTYPDLSDTTNDQPSGPALSSFTIYDAYLYLTNPGSVTKGEFYQFASPFDGTQLQPETSYWVALSDDTADPTPTLAEWEFVEGSNGTNVATNYWTAANYNPSCTTYGAANPCGWLDGSPLPFDPTGSGTKVSFGMQVEYVPEPASLSLLVAGLIGIGVVRRRPRATARAAAPAQ